MEKFYKRIDKIDEKIHSAKLPYNAWKVLFLVTDKTDAREIAAILEEEDAIVQEALNRLVSEKLVTEISEKTVDATPEIEAEETSVEPVFPQDLATEEPEENTNEVDVQISEQESGGEIPDKGDLENEEEAFDLESVFTESEDEKEHEDLEISIADEPEPEIKVEEKPVEEEPLHTEADKESVSGKKKILVVDDSIVIRKMVEIALEDENYHIETAVSGKDGLALIDKINPDLVILDMMLPDINGIEILKAIKASKGIPVIMLSGKDSPQMVEKAKSEGADEFLPKPFKDDELLSKIKNLLE
ncbi:MAG: response regulator transcription factor [Calditrichaceae bacterium]